MNEGESDKILDKAISLLKVAIRDLERRDRIDALNAIYFSEQEIRKTMVKTAKRRVRNE